MTTLSAALCPLKSLFSSATRSISSFQAMPWTSGMKATVAPLVIGQKDFGILTVKKTAIVPGLKSAPNFSKHERKVLQFVE